MNAKNQTCCFTGHRKIPAKEYERLKTQIRKEVIKLINDGVIYFGVGGALGFDTVAANMIIELKKQYPQIKLILVLPCKTQTRGWSQADVDKYEEIKNTCDKYVYVSETYTPGCMYKRNRHLVNNSGYCICYLTESSGGTAYTVGLAKKNGLKIINIAVKGSDNI
ncbi:MAG TPA: DUF1273 domain-containing protein [Clostridiales bacterium]|nr:DUF1273 domain-containing protein [Clostridiales bacterium]